MKTAYELAREEYLKKGIDTEIARKTLLNVPISIHCWQGDDVIGFDSVGSLSGGIQTTGNYPGRARNFEELSRDIEKAFSFMPGKKRLNLHASYALDVEEGVDRDEYEIRHFKKWIELGKKLGLDGIDFNPTLFAHPRMKDGLSLSSPDEEIRKFWIRHCKACIKIAEGLADAFGTPSLLNIWIPDGYKDVPSDRLGPRLRLKASLDSILDMPYDKSKVVVSVESKVFGIGLESYTVGSNEFYQICAAKKGIACLLDNGHYHPLEYVSDKIPALLPFHDKLALHVTRGVRWDSDHVVLFEDEIREICKEIIRCKALDRVMIGLDYFDASINRLVAWVTGQRAVMKAMLYALLIPHEELKRLQDEGRFSELMVLQEEVKTMPFGEVWKEFLRQEGLSEDYVGELLAYGKENVRQ